MNQKLLIAQSALIAGGVAVAWSTIISRFIALHAQFGTIFTLGESPLTNPILTPCFYGGTAFVIAFIWSLTLLLKYRATSERYLSYLLIFGAVFAAVVLSVEMCQYYRIFGGPIIACTPGTYPLYGPCALGGAVYFVSFVWSRIVLFRVRA